MALPWENVAKKKVDSDADNGPEVIVRTFPQSAPRVPAAVHENVKAIFFADDSAEVSSGSNITLQRFVDILNANPRLSAVIEGHTDNFGDEAYNLDLYASSDGGKRCPGESIPDLAWPPQNDWIRVFGATRIQIRPASGRA
ncbi:MAG: OmpA family protein [Terriglobales bacterium]